jgi:hypothetical protein
MDVKSVFLHGELSEEIFMEQPCGFVTDSNPFFQLKKSLYCLKQVPGLIRSIIYFLELVSNIVNLITIYMYSIVMKTP